MNLEELALMGKHTVHSNLAQSIPSKIFEIKKDHIKQALVPFDQISHRLNEIIELGGIKYIDDSKAININSTWYAMEIINSPIIWITGGIYKKNYEILKPLVKEKVKTIITVGLYSQDLIDQFSKDVEKAYKTTYIQKALITARTIAQKGDTVLLSPGCASFDIFGGYKDRGNQFKKFIGAI